VIEITADYSINKLKVMEESCNFVFLKSYSPAVTQKNKSKVRVHLSKSRHGRLNKPIFKDKNKEKKNLKNVSEKNSNFKDYGENMIKSIKIKDIPCGDITGPKKIENSLLQTRTLISPKTNLSPKPYTVHSCNHSCIEWTKYNKNKTKKINMLAIPLYFGFRRHTTSGYGVQKSIIYYETPCGISIQNIAEMMHYLRTTKSKMTIDQFDFNNCVNPLAQFNVSRPIKFLQDLSKGLEFRPITCVNSINDELPPKMKYIISRQATAGVNINVETDFLCGCNCMDNCENKSKCACWQSTINGQNNIPDLEKNPNAGYNYRRLYANVQTGIYECNSTCKCNSLCLNRVVQQPMSHNLQLFKTEKKGWGVRCLNDIARGTFICCYIGNILTETDATEQGKNNGDEYLADLDFIEVVEKCKEDYEEDVFSSQQNDKPQKLSKKTMDLLNKLATKKSSEDHNQTTFKEGNNFFSQNIQYTIIIIIIKYIF
jgi:histone-lysine N-methyltransferase SETDB1